MKLGDTTGLMHSKYFYDFCMFVNYFSPSKVAKEPEHMYRYWNIIKY